MYSWEHFKEYSTCSQWGHSLVFFWPFLLLVVSLFTKYWLRNLSLGSWHLLFPQAGLFFPQIFYGSRSKFILVSVQMPFCQMLHWMHPHHSSRVGTMDPHMTILVSLPFLAALQEMEIISSPLIPSLERKEEEVHRELCSTYHYPMLFLHILCVDRSSPLSAEAVTSCYWCSLLWVQHTEHAWTY